MPGWLLRSTIEDGQFDDEAIVSFTDSSGSLVSLIATRSLIQPDSTGCPSVQVTLLAERNGYRLVQLPGEVFRSGREVTVTDDLVEAMSSDK